MDKNTNKFLEAIKNKIDKKAKDILDFISKSKQETIGQVNKPWHKDNRVVFPLIVTIIFAIAISYGISHHFSAKTDETLAEIKAITTRTESGVEQLLSGSSGDATTPDVGSLGGYTSSPPIKNKIVKASLTPDGTITLWVTLNRPDTLTKKVIFSILVIVL